MNMNATIQKLDELLAKVRAQLIEKKGLKEDPKQPEQEELPQHPDTDYLIKVFNHLKDLGYINTQYEFSEQFLGKNNCAKKNCLGNSVFLRKAMKHYEPKWQL